MIFRGSTDGHLFLKIEVVGVLPFRPSTIPQACDDHLFHHNVQIREMTRVALDLSRLTESPVLSTIVFRTFTTTQSSPDDLPLASLLCRILRFFCLLYH